MPAQLALVTLQQTLPSIVIGLMAEQNDTNGTNSAVFDQDLYGDKNRFEGYAKSIPLEDDDEEEEPGMAPR